MLPIFLGSFAGIPRHRIDIVLQRGYTNPMVEVRVTSLGASLLAAATPQERRSFGLLIRGLLPVAWGARELVPLAYPHHLSPPDIDMRVAAILNAIFVPHSVTAPVPTVSELLLQRIADHIEYLFHRITATPSVTVETLAEVVRHDRPVSRALGEYVLTDPEMLVTCARTLWYHHGYIPPTIVQSLTQQPELATLLVEDGVILPPLVAAAASTPMTAARVVCAGITSPELLGRITRNRQAITTTIRYRPDLDYWGTAGFVPRVVHREETSRQ